MTTGEDSAMTVSVLLLFCLFTNLCFNCSKTVYWMAGFDVKRRDTPRPSKASFQEPSVRVSQRPFDFPNALVCIRADAVSSGCVIRAVQAPAAAATTRFAFAPIYLFLLCCK
eukprot:Gb_01775 [translate_table: standard]